MPISIEKRPKPKKHLYVGRKKAYIDRIIEENKETKNNLEWLQNYK